MIGILFRDYVSTFALESDQYGLVYPHFLNEYKRATCTAAIRLKSQHSTANITDPRPKS